MSADPDIVKARYAGLGDSTDMPMKDTKEERAAKLAAQLRANLHRRKAQARGTAVETTKPDDARRADD
ncbi:MAG TPA: hypothetical protein VF409_11145 [Sphingomonas sp.]